MQQKLAVRELRGQVRADYFHYLIPTIVGQIAHSLYCLADTFFVGAFLGSNALAALNVALPIFTIFTTFSILIGVGAATTISVSRGEGEEGNDNKVFTMAFLSILGVGIITSVAGSFFLRDIAYLFGATDLIVDNVVAYIKPVVAMSFMYLMASTMCVIVRSDGNPRLVMVAATLGNLTNVVLDYVFVAPLGMGIFGAGLATIIGPCVTCAVLSLHFICRRNQVEFTRRCFSGRLFWRMVRNGAGSGVLETSAGFVILMFNITLIRLGGETAVAVFSIISCIGYIVKDVFNGMAQAAQPIIGLSYGAKDYDRMIAVNRLAMITTFVFSLALYVLIFLFPGQIISIFVEPDPNIIALGTGAILLYFISLPFTGMNTILMYYFQSIEQPVHTTIIALMRGIALVYLALLAFSALWGLHGVWLALTAAEAVTFVIFYPIKRRFDRRFIKTPEQAQSVALEAAKTHV